MPGPSPGRRPRIRSSRSTLLVRGVFLLLFVLALYLVYTSQREAGKKPEEAAYRPGMAHLNWLHTVYRMKSDPLERGLLWLATHQGLRRYRHADQSWQVFGLQDGLPSDQVSAVGFDRDRVYIGTWKGLMRLDRATGRFHPFGNTVQEGLAVMDLAAVGEDLWVATSDKGLLRCHKADETCREFGPKDGLASKVVLSITWNKGLLYLGHDNGKITWGSPEAGFSILSHPEAVTSSAATRIWQILLRGDEAWIATSDGGVWVHDFARKGWKQFRRNEGFEARGAYALEQDEEAVYAGTDFGILRYDLAQKIWLALPEGESENRRQVTALHRVGDGNYLWYAAQGRGVGLCATHRVEWVEYPGGLAEEGVRALLPVDDVVWLGYGHNGGYLDLLHEDFRLLRNYNLWVKQDLERVQRLFRLGSTVAMGAVEGFAYYDPKEERPAFRVIRSADIGRLEDVNSLVALDSAGSEWLLGAGTRLYRYRPGDTAAVLDRSLPATYAGCLHFRAPLLHIGTLNRGILVYRREADGKGWTPVGAAGADSLDHVSAVAEWEGNLVFGTRNAGLIRLKPFSDPRAEAAPEAAAGKEGASEGGPSEAGASEAGASETELPALGFEPFGPPGMRQASITGLESEGGNLWATTAGQGVFWLEKKASKWRHLHSRNLLQHDEVFTVRSSPRFVFFGDAVGLTRIRRDSLAALAGYLDGKSETGEGDFKPSGSP